MSGVLSQAPRTDLYDPAYMVGARDAASAPARIEEPRDRVMVTLLALNFLLMAFFAVLSSTAHRPQAAVIAPPAASAEAADGASTGTADAAQVVEEERRRAVDVLRASVARVFAPVISKDDAWRVSTAQRIGNDRVDIEVPSALFTDERFSAEAEAILSGVVGVIDRDVNGYRAELALTASQPVQDEAVGTLAERLVGHGLDPAALSAGIVHHTGAAHDDATLRFTFLLLDDGDEAAVRLAARAGETR